MGAANMHLLPKFLSVGDIWAYSCPKLVVFLCEYIHVCSKHCVNFVFVQNIV